MAFEKGQSGNPGGRPKESAAVKALARQHSEKAVMRLVGLIDSANEATALAAANAILDRAIGKPPQAIVGGDGDDPPIRVEGIAVKLIRPDAT